MSILEIKNDKKYKQFQKSIYRMTALNIQTQYGAVKQQQIDEIRKQLKNLKNKNKKHANSLNFNKENYEKYFKKSATLATQIKSEKINIEKEEGLPAIRQNLNPQFQQLMCNQSSLLNRKVKTETSDFIASKAKRVTVLQKRSKEKNSSNYLFIRSQKIDGSSKIMNKCRLNTQLASLKPQTQNSPAIDNVSDEQHIQHLPQIKQQKQQKQQYRIKTQSILQSRHVKSNSLCIVPSIQKQIVNRSQMGEKIVRKRSTEFRIKLNYNKKDSQIQEINKYKNFVNLIGLSNCFVVSKPGTFKFYVGKGNNGDLPRRLFKKRKWVETAIIQEANLVWTQRRQEKYIQLLSNCMLQSNDKVNKNILVFKLENQNEITKKYKKLLQTQSFEISSKQINYSFTQKIGNKMQQKLVFKKQNLKQINNERISQIKIHNHFAFHHQIAHKKQLFINLKSYYESKNINPFDYIPLTFHISSLTDPQWHKFALKFAQQNKTGQSFWIIKPGQNTNRGTGIKVQKDIQQIKKIAQQMTVTNSDSKSTMIIQKYLMPLLYNKRKFDIRCYVLVTAIGQKMKAYWYQQGYIRTSCKNFSLTNIHNRYIHLTNDAVQKNCTDYGKFQPGNKISFETLSKYIQKLDPNMKFDDIYRQMVKISQDAFEATYMKLHQCGKDFTFQIFGLDFMIDEQFKVWLIQVNRNPCLQTSTFLLDRLISQMLQNAFKIAIDPLLPLPQDLQKSLQKKYGDAFEQNKFKLILDKQLSLHSKQNYHQIIQMSSEEQD